MPVNPPSWRNDTVLPLPNEVKANAWAVDAACSGNPGPMEYQCIDLQTGAQVFHYGPIHGTNNIGEFLAIVHALALMQQKGITDKVIYSDSVNAQLWVQKKQCKTKLVHTPQTEQLHQIIARAENWLRTHNVYEYMNVILDARYNVSLTKAGKGDWDNCKNKVLTFTVGYRFTL